MGIGASPHDLMVARINGDVELVRSIQRLPREIRFDPDLFDSIKGVPWLPNPAEKQVSSGARTGLKMPIVPETPDAQLLRDPVVRRPGQERHFSFLPSPTRRALIVP